MDEAAIAELMELLNDPEVYPDKVERIIEQKFVGNVRYVIAIDEGNPPVIPLKQIAFKFVYADDTFQDLTSYEFKLLNPEEVEGNASRPQQFAAYFQAGYWEQIESEEFWDTGDCANCIPDPALI